MDAGCVHVLSWFLWAVVTKKSQMGQLTITDVHSFKGLGTRSPRSGCHRGPDSSEDSRGAPVPCLSFRKGTASGTAGSPWCALTCRCIPPASASIITWLSLVCVSVLLQGHLPVVELGLILLVIISKDLTSKDGHVHKCSGPGFHHVFWSDAVQPVPCTIPFHKAPPHTNPSPDISHGT